MKREICHGCPSRALCLIEADFAHPQNVCFCAICEAALIIEPRLRLLRQRPKALAPILRIRPVKINCDDILKRLVATKTHLDGKCPACAASTQADVGMLDWKEQFAVMLIPEDR